jgi:Sugar kinases, ribokinase family
MNIDIQGKTFLPFRSGDSNPGSLSLVPGGVGRNIAENLARLGAEVELITVLGDDQYAPLLEASCRAVGVGLENAIRLENCPSSCYLCILDANGSLAGGLSSMDSIDRLLPDRLEQRAKLLDSVELIIVDANVPVATINWLASRYPKGTTRPLLGFDPVSEKKAERGRAALGSFAFAKPNRAEAAVLADYIGQRCGEPVDLSPDALASVLCQKGLDSAFISLGFEGLWAQGPKRERWVARLPKKRLSDGASKSCSGAGDAACAAIAWGLLQGQSLGERCSLALAAGMLTAASLTPVNPEMREDRLIEIAKGIECERIS